MCRKSTEQNSEKFAYFLYIYYFFYSCLFQNWTIWLCWSSPAALPSSINPQWALTRSSQQWKQIYSKWKVKTPEIHQWRRSCVFNVKFRYISLVTLVFVLLTLNIKILNGVAVRKRKKKRNENSYHKSHFFLNFNVTHFFLHFKVLSSRGDDHIHSAK